MALASSDRRLPTTGYRIIIGIGNPDRGDDAVGLHVIQCLAERLPPEIRIVENHGDIGHLATAIENASHAVVVDAVCSGAEPGTIHEFDAADTPLPSRYFRCSTHAFGVAETIELMRSLDRLPKTLLVYGIEGWDFVTGAELSEEINASIDETAALIVKRVDSWPTGGTR
jgi:hydrogenase maturation protease